MGLHINTGATRSFQCFADTGLNLGASVVDMLSVTVLTKFVGLGDSLASLINESFVHCVM